MNEYHKKHSPHFRYEYANYTFEHRKRQLQAKAGAGELRVDVAEAEKTGRAVAYCITTVDKNGRGEIESVFVKQDYRGRGIGNCLVKKALAWMEQLGTKEKIAAVAAGNESAFAFYARYGFSPRQTILKQKHLWGTNR